jgi:cysteine desulfurase
MKKELIYLDHCSTTPLDPCVLDAMLPFLRESFGNPGTPHPLFGGIVQRAVREAREAAAQLINCRANELIWTSGATEANNLAILGLAENTPDAKRHIVTQVTEHSAVLEPCRHLEAKGWQVTYLPVDQFGQINIQVLKNAITDSTSLVSIMWGNNEIGTIQPVEEIACICVERGVLFHCDAAQAVGKVAIDLENVAVSMLTFSAHKLYGPKGVGALFIRDLNKQQLISPRQFGGGQENSLRAGTLNVPCVVGMGAACSLAVVNQLRGSEHTIGLRQRFESILLDRLQEISINGHEINRLPHISNLAFHGTDNEGLLTMLPELVASTGSACHVADFAPSHVLDALPIRPKPTECSLRFGFGKNNTLEEVETAASLVVDAVEKYRSASE